MLERGECDKRWGRCYNPTSIFRATQTDRFVLGTDLFIWKDTRAMASAVSGGKIASFLLQMETLKKRQKFDNKTNS